MLASPMLHYTLTLTPSRPSGNTLKNPIDYVQVKRDEQMLKRRNMTIEPDTPLTESNKQVSGGTILNRIMILASAGIFVLYSVFSHLSECPISLYVHVAVINNQGPVLCTE